eukprot:758401-Pyramimonas_sp.AAC.1
MGEVPRGSTRTVDIYIPVVRHEAVLSRVDLQHVSAPPSRLALHCLARSATVGCHGSERSCSRRAGQPGARLATPHPRTSESHLVNKLLKVHTWAIMGDITRG